MSADTSKGKGTVHIASTGFFKPLDALLQQELIAGLDRTILEAGDYLFHQGDSCEDGMYVVIDGHLQVLADQGDGTQIELADIKGDTILGEIGLFTDSARTTSVRAVEKTTLAQVSRPVFERLSKESPEIMFQVGKLVLQRLRESQMMTVLPNLFGPLDLEALEDVKRELRWLYLNRGDILIRQGTSGNSLFLLISGRLQAVVTDAMGYDRVVGEISPGESVGEMQILTGEKRSASVYATRDSELVKLSKAAFDRLAAKHPMMMKHIAQLVIKRLQHTLQRSTRGVNNRAFDLVLVPANADVPLAEFSERLEKALGNFGATLVLDEERFDSHLGKSGMAQISEHDPNNVRVTVWLNEQSPSYDFTIYQTNLGLTNWTKRCLRQADLILVVANANSDTALGEVEDSLISTKTGRRRTKQGLVLLHTDGKQQPVNTHRWLDRRRVDEHYHVRWDRPDDYKRLVRLITGQGIGLVLSGGGAKGFAHVGVFQALEELGINVDLVGGASFGAIASAAYALEWNPGDIYNAVKKMLGGKGFVDYTLPLTSFFAGERVVQLLQEFFGDTRIEDAWRSYFCMTTDLNSYQEIAHRRGHIWKYVRASGALPAFFPPIIDGDQVLVDGGIMNNIPLNVMRGLTRHGPVIGVDVGTARSMPTHEYQVGPSLSGWKTFWNRINPLASKIKTPSMFDLLVRWASISSDLSREDSEKYADLYIRPDVGQYGLFGVDEIDDIIRAGYVSGKEQIAEWMKGDGKQFFD